MEYIAQKIEDLERIANEIMAVAESENIWIFEGEMGAGKTTLIKQICKQKGVMGNVQSPTFSIVNEYLTEANETLYHFDFYRLKNPTEALDIGVEEYFDSGNICLIEWVEKIGNLLPPNHLKVSIFVDGKQHRNITVEKIQEIY